MNLTPELTDRMRDRAKALGVLVAHLSEQKDLPNAELAKLSLTVATDLITVLEVIEGIRREIATLYEES